MGNIERFISDMNHLSGVFLLIIAFAVSSCAAGIHAVKRELECLHEDYDTVTNAHEILEAKRMAGI
jgi:hypothetical protein